MKGLILLALGLASAAALSIPNTCHVSEWGPWTKCNRLTPCVDPNQPKSKSFHKAPALYDKGRKTMEQLMAEKTRDRMERQQCLAAGTCPERAPRRTEGPAQCVGGMASSYPCLNIDLVYFISIEDLDPGTPPAFDPFPQANDLWAWTDPSNGDEYVIQGLSYGTSFVRISPDPENPTVVAFLPTRSTDAKIWRDMKVIGNFAFIVSECTDHGMQVFDLTQLRGLQTFTRVKADAEYNLVGNSHNIVANPETNFVYIVGATDPVYDPNNCVAGLHAIDVTNPNNPQFAGCFGLDSYVHDAQCLIYRGPDATYNGRELCFCYNEDTLTIVDVHDKADMRMISKVGYTDAAYTHQGWLTEDHTVLLLDDEVDETEHPLDPRTRTYIWDVRDLDNPRLMNTHFSSEPAADHNQYVRGNFTYQSNYKAGLRILGIDNQNFRLNEVAFFDNHPESTDTGYSGSWSNYPYFASGVVPASSIDHGLFLLRPNQAAMKQLYESRDTTPAKQTRQRHVLSTSSDARCPATLESRPCKSDQC